MSVPFKLLDNLVDRDHVEVQTNTGDTYEGLLTSVEENLSVTMAKVKVTFASGEKVDMHSVYIRGTKIRLISLPDSCEDSLRRIKSRLQSFRGGRGGRGGFRGRSRGRGGGGGGGGGGGYRRDNRSYR